MRDEIFDREYQQARHTMNDGIDKAFARIAGAVRRFKPAGNQGRAAPTATRRA